RRTMRASGFACTNSATACSTRVRDTEVVPETLLLMTSKVFMGSFFIEVFDRRDGGDAFHCREMRSAASSEDGRRAGFRAPVAHLGELPAELGDALFAARERFGG